MTEEMKKELQNFLTELMQSEECSSYRTDMMYRTQEYFNATIEDTFFVINCIERIIPRPNGISLPSAFKRVLGPIKSRISLLMKRTTLQNECIRFIAVVKKESNHFMAPVVMHEEFYLHNNVISSEMPIQFRKA